MKWVLSLSECAMEVQTGYDPVTRDYESLVLPTELLNHGVPEGVRTLGFQRDRLAL